MTRRRLPTGIHAFRKIREDNCYYVDKTGYALQLLDEGTHFFLSRPRRFGKSLFVDTLKELFEGSRELFRGLRAHGRWNWSARHPVVRLDFGKGNFKEPGFLQIDVLSQLRALERIAGIEPLDEHPVERFAFLVQELHRETGQRVVVLVDEYDKPILDALAEPDLARANRDFLRGLYSVIKFCDAHIRFAFITGVSKFSKVSLFSGLNNLRDITLSPLYSAICGYTDRDLDEVFAPELPGLDREQIRDWYNGYSWGGEEKVYNPFDMLLLFTEREFDAWWFETGTPTFLFRTLFDRRVVMPSLDGKLVSKRSLGTFDVGRVGTDALLFQAGYLTVLSSEVHEGIRYFRLGYPNREVRQSLNASLLQYLVEDWPGEAEDALRLGQLLRAADFEGLQELMHAFFASIPHQWHTGTKIKLAEGYYASVFYSYFAGVGLDVTVEESTSAGRVDMVVQVGGLVFVFEFKVLERAGAGAALEQIKARRYADKYRRKGKPIYLVGVEFSAKTRNVKRFEVELAHQG